MSAPNAIGDKVIATRNERRLEVVNGQRGTITAIDPEHETTTIDNSGRTVTVDSVYLRDGHLDYGYAITAHRAQGATVDRTSVPGSDELYREWGYTALSRHRDEARFYLTRGDLALDRDHAPEPDPLAAGLRRLLGRSRAQQLASESLPEVSDSTLTTTQEELRERLAADPPPAQREHHQRAPLREQLEDTTARLERLRAERERLSWSGRRQRRQLDELIAHHSSHQDHLADQSQHLHDAHVAQDAWLSGHRADVELFLRVDGERNDRRHISHAAKQRLAHLQQPPDLLAEVPQHAPDLDTGLDL